MAEVSSEVLQNNQLNAREYAARALQLESFPSRIQIGTDNRCNMRCPFCLASAYRQVGLVHLQDQRMERNPIELFERLVPFMKYWEFVSLTGPGESLINPRFPEVLELVRRHSDCYLVVTTNGVLINRKLAEALVRQRVQEVAISLDSLDPELYRELRVNGELDEVLAAIRYLQEERRAAGSDCPEISLTPTFHRLNIEELPDFVRFVSEHGLRNVQASPLQVYREDWVDRSLLHYPALTRRVAEEATRLAEQLGVKLVNNLRMVYVNRGRGPLSFLKARESLDFPTDPSTCRKPWNNLYVEPDGEVRPCCHQSPVYGNLYQDDFETIWNGPEARKLRRQMTEHHPPEQCRQCYEFNRHNPDVMIQLLTEESPRNGAVASADR